MPPKPWKTLSTREVYKNNWIRIREDVAELPNGKTTIYGVCEFGQAVGVLPFVDQDHVLMVRQYRYVQQENHRWEIPTGGVKPGESLEAAAQRELMEEIGHRAKTLTHINSFYSSKSVCEEVAHLYIGRDLIRADAPPDHTEFLEVETFPFTDVLEMTLSSEIRDSMTVIAVLISAKIRQAGGLF
jgi:ADP-ribose pyrophosphatase